VPPDLRFSGRVHAYVAGRPGYPSELPSLLQARFGLPQPFVVADLGSGTGLLSRVFVAAGHTVMGVEPDAQMAAAASADPVLAERFQDVRGPAENTGLMDSSVDLVAVGQAFHWFEPARARAEARRILRGRGLAALVWNERPRVPTDPNLTPALADYEALVCRWDTGTYRETESRWAKQHPMTVFFGRTPPRPLVLHHIHRVSRDGLVARAASCSYLPGTTHPRFDAMVGELDDLFARHARGGLLDMPYRTMVFAGWLD
jgi:SAM-dependent methyltransferase